MYLGCKTGTSVVTLYHDVLSRGAADAETKKLSYLPPVPEVFTEMSLTMRRGKRGYKLEGQNGVEREAGVGIHLQRLARTRVYGEAN
jgi:hypothetical protein